MQAGFEQMPEIWRACCTVAERAMKACLPTPDLANPDGDLAQEPIRLLEAEARRPVPFADPRFNSVVTGKATCGVPRTVRQGMTRPFAVKVMLPLRERMPVAAE